MITPVLFIAYYIFLLVKFSGRPYINENLRQQVSRILRVVFVWSIARLVIKFKKGNWYYRYNFI